TVAVIVFRLVLGGDLSVSPRGWLAAVAATLGSELVGTATLKVAARGAGRGPGWREVLRLSGIQLVATVAATSIALVAAATLWEDGRASWLLVAVAAVLLFGYRAHRSLSRRYASLERLYGFTRSVGRSPQTDVVVTAMLTQTRD